MNKQQVRMKPTGKQRRAMKVAKAFGQKGLSHCRLLLKLSN